PLPPPHLSTLSLHDALPIYPRCLKRWPAACVGPRRRFVEPFRAPRRTGPIGGDGFGWTCSASTSPPRTPSSARGTRTAPPGKRADRKSTRLNSSHVSISYAV